MSRTSAYFLLLAATALWCGGILLAPVLAQNGSGFAGPLYEFFSRLCHQRADRSFYVDGFACAVCIRCSAIYAGFFVGAVLFPVLRRWQGKTTRLLWVPAALPMLVDVALDLSGLHTSSAETRIVTGALFGLVAAGILTPIIIDLLTSYRHPPLPTMEHQP